jgi:hypothetical protein
MRDNALRITTTDAHGQFTIADSTPSGAISAQLADRRATPVAIADHVTLALEPTRTLQGTVDLHGTPPAYVQLKIISLAGTYVHTDPIASDGSFMIAGVPIHALQLDVWIRGASESDLSVVSQPVPASRAPLTGLHLEVTRSSRSLDVIVHSAVDTPIAGAWLKIIPGTHEIKTAGELGTYTANAQYATAVPIAPSQVGTALVDKVHPGDLLAHVDHVRDGALTLCGGSHGGAVVRLEDRIVRCAHVSPETSQIELVLPPQPRIN